MPHCRKCNQDHYNFQSCPDPPGTVVNRMGWGQPFGNADRPGRHLIATLPFRQRTGSLVEPPQAA